VEISFTGGTSPKALRKGGDSQREKEKNQAGTSSESQVTRTRYGSKEALKVTTRGGKPSQQQKKGGESAQHASRKEKLFDRRHTGLRRSGT